MARLTPLFSGSTGNSYYIGTKSAGLLIDAGRSAKQLDAMLRTCSIDPLAIQGILITHEHSDHVNGLRVFSRRYSLPVFASAGTLDALYGSLDGVQTCVLNSALQLADMTVRPVHTSHDSKEPIGFRISLPEDKDFAFFTDLGYISEAVEDGLLGADFAVIESNHDINMLRENPLYPASLKGRILSDRGHLSNEACSSLLPALRRSGTVRFLLAHLSRENNTRQAALASARTALLSDGASEGTDFLLDAAHPENPNGKSIIF